MEYSLNIKILEKLMDIEAKILDGFKFFILLKSVKGDKYSNDFIDNEISKLNVLIKKENILIEQLPKQSELLKYAYELVSKNKSNLFEDSVNSDLVFNRFENIMIDLVNIYEEEEEEELYREMNVDYNNFDSMRNRIAIRDNINLKNLVLLDELSKRHDKSLLPTFLSTSYSIAYFYKNIGDELLKKSFDLSDLEYYSDDAISKELHLSADEYNSLKNDELHNMAQELFFEMLCFINDDNNIDNNYSVIKDSLRFRFLLHEMSTPLLYMFNELASECVNNMGEVDEVVLELMSIIQLELDKRTDLVVQVEKNFNREVIDEKTADCLINLIKLEEKILDVFDQIDFDDIHNKDHINLLSYLVSIEKSYVDNINISYKTVDIIDSMLFNDMEFFFDNYVSKEDNQRKKELIYERLKNIIPFFEHVSLSPTQSEKSYASINQNHIISALKIFEKKIDEVKDVDKKNSLKQLYKNLFFINGILLDDYILIDGNYKLISRFSDDISAKEIGMSDVEYAFDKDEQLYEEAKNIIEEILSYEDEWADDLTIFALFEFKLSQLSDIMVNISDEHIYSLPVVVKDLTTYKSPKSKKIISKIINK